MTKHDVREFQKYKTRGAYHWEQISKHYLKRNSFVLGRYKNMIALLENALGDIKNKKVLDIGCGDGVLSYMLSQKGAIVSGVDYSDIAIDFAKEKTQNMGIDFRQGSAYELPFTDNYFDAVVSSDVIEHLEDVDIYFSEIKRVVVERGSVIISTPIRYTEFPLDKEHVIEWFPTEFVSLMDNNFKEVNYYYSHPLALEELYQALYLKKQYGRAIINLLSLISNPFEGFQSRFKYNSLQYAVIKV